LMRILTGNRKGCNSNHQKIWLLLYAE